MRRQACRARRPFSGHHQIGYLLTARFAVAFPRQSSTPARNSALSVPKSAAPIPPAAPGALITTSRSLINMPTQFSSARPWCSLFPLSPLFVGQNGRCALRTTQRIADYRTPLSRIGGGITTIQFSFQQRAFCVSPITKCRKHRAALKKSGLSKRLSLIRRAQMAAGH